MHFFPSMTRILSHRIYIKIIRSHAASHSSMVITRNICRVRCSIRDTSFKSARIKFSRRLSPYFTLYVHEKLLRRIRSAIRIVFVVFSLAVRFSKAVYVRDTWVDGRIINNVGNKWHDGILYAKSAINFYAPRNRRRSDIELSFHSVYERDFE